MENTIGSEPELEKHDDSVTETPPTQAPEAENREGTKQESDPLKRLQDELAEARDKYVRLYAEFENHRRRTAREKLEMIQGANENLLRSLLAVTDDFERAEKFFKEKNDKGSEGFFLIQNKFKKLLELNGVKVMDVGKGSDFNADIHEAITQVPVEDKALKGKVIDVVEKGYLLNEKVVRFAKVVTGA